VTDVSDRRLASKQTAFSEIPIIDIAALVDGSDPDGVAREIGDVCETVGFFYVKNHGVPHDLVECMYAAMQRFFGLPLEIKQRLHVANSGPTLRGYIPPYGENADPNNSRDLALSRSGGEEGKNLGALVDDVRRRVDALDPTGSIVIELKHRHTGLLRRASHPDGNDDGNPRRRPRPCRNAHVRLASTVATLASVHPYLESKCMPSVNGQVAVPVVAK